MDVVRRANRAAADGDASFDLVREFGAASRANEEKVWRVKLGCGVLFVRATAAGQQSTAGLGWV